MQIELYSAWCVRTPVSEDETFKEAQQRIIERAQEMEIEVRFRKGKGQRYQTPRYHFWECQSEPDAMALLLACGDQVIPTQYPKNLAVSN